MARAAAKWANIVPSQYQKLIGNRRKAEIFVFPRLVRWPNALRPAPKNSQLKGCQRICNSFDATNYHD